ncbi:unnamed protein product [Rotaria socialis]|uniref:PWWP domain-containing protein n=2 Tax=Rotaria socialis TaxID=392032 RepID=A0A819ZJW6_9BILA|nr:unnamed protein product [Rotaria socialis]CAF4311580.1 unnamed protein product [Rotaria socialis]CAF4405502.1 unnamed protein product [Rotaria socialis]
MMVDCVNTDEPISNRRSKRASRSSILKPQPSIEQPKEIESLVEDIEVDEEDPPELFQLGDILWVHITGSPWWPALIYGSYYEDNLHTKVVKTAHRPKKRLYFVYFFGPAFEYTWAHPHHLMAYSGLDDFIQQAESSVQNAPKKFMQEMLANRFLLKVAANKRPHWDQAIQEADAALKLTRQQRVENFTELLKTILQKAESNSLFLYKATNKLMFLENTSSKRRRSSITTRESRKTSSPTSDKSSTRSSVKRQKTKSTPVSTTLLHVGLPTLTKREEKRIVNNLLEHPNHEQLTLREAQSFVCQLVTEIIKENSHYNMSCVQIEWFYDKKQFKRKQHDDDILESSIFDLLADEFHIGDVVWAKLNGFTWWPAFVYGCFSEDWVHVKPITKPVVSTKKQYFVYCFGWDFKHGWTSQVCLHPYKGLEDFLNYTETKIEQATTKRREESIRKRFDMKMPEDLHPYWKEAIKEADEVLCLPISLRISAFEKMLTSLLAGTKYKIPQNGYERVVLPDRVSINEEQQLQSNSFIIPTINESDNDVVIVKINSPTPSSPASLTTAICHFLDKGIPSLTIYEELRLVNDLMHHRLGGLLTLTDAQLYVEQYAINIASMNYNHRMLYVQGDFFYDFLLKYPQIILIHRQWFKDFKQTLMPLNSDRIQLKKWQLSTLLHAHIDLEKKFH